MSADEFGGDKFGGGVILSTHFGLFVLMVAEVLIHCTRLAMNISKSVLEWTSSTNLQKQSFGLC
jgi:hypothetical protein